MLPSVMKQLEEYIKEMGNDVDLDEFNLKDTQLKLPALKHKWVGRLIRHKNELERYQSSRDVMIKQVAQEIIEQATYQVTLPSAQKAAEKHTTIKKIDENIREQKLIIDFLEKGEKIFSGMGFDIKNIIEIMKLETL
jgi:ribosomal protein L17